MEHLLRQDTLESMVNLAIQVFQALAGSQELPASAAILELELPASAATQDSR